MAKQSRLTQTKCVRIQHGPLEVEAVGLDFVDQAGLQRRGGVARIGVLRPQVEPLHEDGHDQPVDEDQRQRAAHGFERPPQQQSPLAAGAVLHHQQRQPADAKPQVTMVPSAQARSK